MRLPDDVIGQICAHVPLKERLSICNAVSKTFRTEAQRLGGRLSLVKEATSSQPPSWTWSQDGVSFGLSDAHGAPHPTMHCTELELTGFAASKVTMQETLLAHRGVRKLSLELCTGELLPWLSALRPLEALKTLEWNNSAVPFQVAMTAVASMRSLQHVHFKICLTPQWHPYSTAQLRSALLPVGLLAAIPTLRHLSLMEGPREGEGESDVQLFGYEAQYHKSELDCDEDVISGLCLGLSALHQVTAIECDMIGDWCGSFADAFSFMLARLPGLRELGEVFFLRVATWESLRRALPPTGHPSLERLRLRFSEPEDDELETMAQSVCNVFPHLREIDLQIHNTHQNSEKVAQLLNGLREHPRLHRVYIDLDCTDDQSLAQLQVVFGGLAAIVEVAVEVAVECGQRS